MKIIRPGIVDITLRGECKDCTTIVEANKKECMHSRTMEDIHRYSIKCPTEGCGNIIIMKPIIEGKNKPITVSL